MKNISLRGIDARTAARLKEQARQTGVSVNTLILQLIRRGTGLESKSPRRPVYCDLDALAGTWSAKECAAFSKATADFEQVDKDIWREARSA